MAPRFFSRAKSRRRRDSKVYPISMLNGDDHPVQPLISPTIQPIEITPSTTIMIKKEALSSSSSLMAATESARNLLFQTQSAILGSKDPLLPDSNRPSSGRKRKLFHNINQAVKRVMTGIKRLATFPHQTSHSNNNEIFNIDDKIGILHQQSRLDVQFDVAAADQCISFELDDIVIPPELLAELTMFQTVLREQATLNLEPTISLEQKDGNIPDQSDSARRESEFPATILGYYIGDKNQDDNLGDSFPDLSYICQLYESKELDQLDQERELIVKEKCHGLINPEQLKYKVDHRSGSTTSSPTASTTSISSNKSGNRSSPKMSQLISIFERQTMDLSTFPDNPPNE